MYDICHTNRKELQGEIMEKKTNPFLKNKFINTFGINKIFGTESVKEFQLFFFKKGDYICKEGENLDYLFFFVQGKAKVFSTLKNGKNILSCFYSPFKVIGELEILNNETAISNICVIEDSYCIGVSSQIIKDCFMKNSVFMQFIWQALSEKLKKSAKNNTISLGYPLENKLASYIIASCSKKTIDNESFYIFQENLTEVSELLGASYRHLLRCLKKFVEDEYLEKDKDYYKIISHEKLSTLSQDLYRA